VHVPATPSSAQAEEPATSKPQTIIMGVAMVEILKTDFIFNLRPPFRSCDATVIDSWVAVPSFRLESHLNAELTEGRAVMIRS